MAELRPQLPEEDRTDERVERWLLEAAAIRLYNERRIGHGGFGQMLGLAWAETERFLIENKVVRNYSDEDVDHDLAFIESSQATSR